LDHVEEKILGQCQMLHDFPNRPLFRRGLEVHLRFGQSLYAGQNHIARALKIIRDLFALRFGQRRRRRFSGLRHHLI